MTQRVDFYALLGVKPDATLREIQRAYRERVKGCHPDRLVGVDDELRRMAQEKMVQLNEAHRILRSPELRARYDAKWRVAAGAAAPPAEKPRPPRPAASGDGRTRVEGHDLVVRAATEQLRGRVTEAGREHRWRELDATGVTLALEGRRGVRRDVILVTTMGRLDEAALSSALRRFHVRTRELGSSWWQKDVVHGFAAAVHFVDLGRLTGIVERFNETQARDGRPLQAAMVDLVNWTAAPGPRDLEGHLRFLQP
jgi:curved DNA-binding protein CbpA